MKSSRSNSYLLVCLSVGRSICLPVFSPVHLSVSLSTCLPVYHPTCLLVSCIGPLVCLYLCVCLCVCLYSVCLSVCLPASLSIFCLQIYILRFLTILSGSREEVPRGCISQLGSLLADFGGEGMTLASVVPPSIQRV